MLRFALLLSSLSVSRCGGRLPANFRRIKVAGPLVTFSGYRSVQVMLQLTVVANKIQMFV